MLNHWTIVPVFVLLFLAVNLAIGLLAGRGHVKSTADHVVGGRSLGLLLVFFMSIGEIYSSVAFLGQPGWAYEHGVQILANVGIFIGMMAFWLGPRIWAFGREHGCVTQAQLFGDRFQSPKLRAIASITGLAALIPYISIQMIGAGYVFNITTSGRVPYWAGALLAFSVVGIYVYAGGLRAISWVAVLKGCFMATVGLYVVYRVVHHFYGGVPAMFHQIALRSPANLTLPGPKGFATYTFHTTSLLNSLVAFYMWPHMFANFFGARDPGVIRRQTMFIPLYNIITLSFTLVGFAGILVLRGIRPDTVMVEMLLRVAPLWLVGLFCAGALSASMVTGGACALAAAATDRQRSPAAISAVARSQAEESDSTARVRRGRRGVWYSPHTACFDRVHHPDGLRVHRPVISGGDRRLLHAGTVRNAGSVRPGSGIRHRNDFCAAHRAATVQHSSRHSGIGGQRYGVVDRDCP